MRGGSNIIFFITEGYSKKVDMNKLSTEVKKIIADIKADPELKDKATWMFTVKFYKKLEEKYPNFIEERKSWDRANYDAITSLFSTGSLH